MDLHIDLYECTRVTWRILIVATVNTVFACTRNPYNHQVNSSEEYIQTFENYYMAGLATTDPN